MIESFEHRRDSQWVLSKSFYAILFCVGIGTFAIHEFAHWIAGVALGHDMTASPNHVSPVGPISDGDRLVVAAAGPLVTIAQGIVGVRLAGRGRPMLGYALLYMAFFMRLLAAAVSVSNPNDEARISLLLDLGTWTVPFIVVAGLLALVVNASRRLRLGFRDQLSCFITGSAVITLIVGLDAAVR